MSAYIDTDVLTAYYCPEPMSAVVERQLTALNRPTISTLTEVEFCSVIAKKVRQREIKRVHAERLLAQFLIHRDSGFYSVVPLQTEHFRLARDWLATLSTPLRTQDALHLAVAVVAKLPLMTADRSFASAATKLGARIIAVK